MDVVTTKPAPELAAQIAFFWAVPRSRRTTGTLFECYPDGGTSLVFRLSSSGCRLALLGPSTERVALPLDDDADYLAVRFRAGQAFRLADIAPRDLADHLVELHRVGGLRTADWAERLAKQPDLASRQRLIEATLIRCGPAIRDERIRRAALLIEERDGQLRIDALSDSLGLHVRSLQRSFLEHVGVGPKRLARLARARHVLSRLTSGPCASLVDLAYECGYADQAHMNREFRELTGRCPSDPDALQPLRPLRAESSPLVRRCNG